MSISYLYAALPTFGEADDQCRTDLTDVGPLLFEELRAQDRYRGLFDDEQSPVTDATVILTDDQNWSRTAWGETLPPGIEEQLLRSHPLHL